MTRGLRRTCGECGRVYAVTVIVCDRCSSELVTDSQTIPDARRYAARHGWRSETRSVVGDYRRVDYCPACKGDDVGADTYSGV
jgi:hypothetical protein